MKLKTMLKSGSALSLVAALTVVAAGTAMAEFPKKPIKLYVGFSAGGGTDTAARGFASYVHEAKGMNGMPMIIVNKPGGSGMQAAKVVKEAKPDGYTLYIINSGTFAAADMSRKTAPVNPRKDFTSIGCMTRLVTALTVHSSSPHKDAGSWVKAMKDSGKTVRWSTSGAATMHALIGHLMFDTWGLKNKKIPFKGGSKARTALVAQKVDVAFNAIHLVKGFEKDTRAIGVPLDKRDPANKNVKTFGEAGLPGINVSGPMCIWGPVGMPDAVVNKLRAAVKHVAGIKGFKKFMKKSGLASIYTSAEGSVKALNNLYDTLGPVVEKVGLRK